MTDALWFVSAANWHDSDAYSKSSRGRKKELESAFVVDPMSKLSEQEVAGPAMCVFELVFQLL